MMWGATRCTLFHTEFGVMSGPGADVGDERARALLISSVSRAWQSAKGRRMVSLEGSEGGFLFFIFFIFFIFYFYIMYSLLKYKNPCKALAMT